VDDDKVATDTGKSGRALAHASDFATSRIPKLAHLVANRLRWHMTNGQLRPGDTLPREAELMTRFGVSRPALREALRILEDESLIAIGRGTRGGATVLEPTIDKVAQYGTLWLVASGTRLADLHEARTLVAPGIVEKLAANPRPEVVAELRRCSAEGLEALDAGNLNGAILASNAFHEQLIGCSDNRAIGLLVGMLHDISEQNYSLIDELWSPDPEKRKLIRKAFKAHQRLTELIEQGLAEEAKRFWRDYMIKTAEVLASTGQAGALIALDTA
jgi:GntR family transcriptional repressor for pyruvate dehydrogenase complex